MVGCIAPVKALLYGPHPPLRVVSEALETLSDGLIPISLPLLGAVLARWVGWLVAGEREGGWAGLPTACVALSSCC